MQRNANIEQTSEINKAKVLAVSVRKSLCIFMKPPRRQNLDLQDIKNRKNVKIRLKNGRIM